MNTKDLERWFRSPSDLEVWEDIATWFHQETGHLRPGKDKPTGFHQTDEGEPDCCHDAWILWVDAKRIDAQRSLLDDRRRHLEAFDRIRIEDLSAFNCKLIAAKAQGLIP